MDVDKPVVSFSSLLKPGFRPPEGSIIRGTLVGIRYVEDSKITLLRLDSVHPNDEQRHVSVELRRMKPAFDAWTSKTVGSNFELELAGCEVTGDVKRLVFKDAVTGRYSSGDGWERFTYAAGSFHLASPHVALLKAASREEERQTQGTSPGRPRVFPQASG